ncbi:unnamed protein product, partial [Prorocentrum cordatum]
MEAPNVPAQGMRCLGLWLEHPNHTNDKLVEAWDLAKEKANPVVLGKPDVDGAVGRDPVGSASFFDLPIKHWNYRPRAYIKTAADVITEAPGMEAMAWDDVKQIMDEGRYKDLPPPLGYASTEDELPCTMNMLVCKNPSDPQSHIILKHFTSLGNGHTMSEIQSKLIQGDACAIDFRPDRFNSMRTFQILLEWMGGILFRYWRCERPSAVRGPVGEGDVAQKQKELADAMQHTKDEAPRTNWDGEQLLWVEQEYCDPASPLANVRKEFVNKALQILKDRDHFAAKETHYPLLKGDIRNEYQPVIDRIPRALLGNTVVFIGEAKFGKTPLMHILAMAMARYHADCVNEKRGRVARKRHEMLLQIPPKAGETWVPCVFDDGDLSDQRPRVLKAFFDPTQVESNVYVRWGAAKFKRNQARFGGDNEYDAESEPSQTDWHFASRSPEKEKRTTAYLVEMIKPAFPKNLSFSNVGAMLKRSNICLNTKYNLYVRPCGTFALVEKLPLLDGYTTPEAGKRLQNCLRNNVRRDQEEFDNLLAFEKRDMLKLMADAKKEFKEDGGDADDQPAPEPARPAAPVQDEDED